MGGSRREGRPKKGGRREGVDEARAWASDSTEGVGGRVWASDSTAAREAAGRLAPASLGEPLARLLAKQSPLQLTRLLAAPPPCYLHLLLRRRPRRRLGLRRRRRRSPGSFVAAVGRAEAQPLPSGRLRAVCDPLLLRLVVRMQRDPAAPLGHVFVPLDLVAARLSLRLTRRLRVGLRVGLQAQVHT